MVALVSPDNWSVLGGGKQSLRSCPLLRAHQPPVLTRKGKGSSGFALTGASFGRASRHAGRSRTSSNYTYVLCSVGCMTLAVELEQHHIEIMERVAGNLAKTSFGRLAGREELVSEGLVALVELATIFDPTRSHTGSFEDFLVAKIRWKLIDYLRSAYGRATKIEEGQCIKPNARLVGTFQTFSMDSLAPGTDTPLQVPMPGPSVEDQAIAKVEWEQFLEILDGLDEVDQALLLWPLTGENSEDLQQELGWSKSVAAYERRMVKNQVCDQMGRPISVKSKRPHKTQTDVQMSRPLDHGDEDAEDVASDATPEGRESSVDRSGDGVLAVDRRPGSRRIRKTRSANRPPRSLEDAARLDSRRAGTGSSLLREVLCESGSSGAGDQGREHPQSGSGGPQPLDVPERPRQVDPRPSPGEREPVLHGLQRGEQAQAPSPQKGRGGMARLTISDEDLLSRIQAGETQTEIASEFGVYPGTVHYRLKAMGQTVNRNTDNRKRLFPFRVPSRDHGLYEIRMLKNLIALADGRRQINPTSQAFGRFIRHCLSQNLVVDYDESVGVRYLPFDGPSDAHPYRIPGIEPFIRNLPAKTGVCPTCAQEVG